MKYYGSIPDLMKADEQTPMDFMERQYPVCVGLEDVWWLQSTSRIHDSWALIVWVHLTATVILGKLLCVQYSMEACACTEACRCPSRDGVHGSFSSRWFRSLRFKHRFMSVENSWKMCLIRILTWHLNCHLQEQGSAALCWWMKTGKSNSLERKDSIQCLKRTG